MHIHDEFIKANYLIMSSREIEKIIHKSRCYIKNRMKALGISVPEEIKQKRMAAARFKDGSIPKNKGEKMSPELYERCQHTFFKKGNTPHNVKYDGHERIDKEGYVYIRVSKGNYQLKHRVVWEAANGKIPEDMLVAFKDGNRANTALENLELITKIENALRHSQHNIHPELIPTFVLINQLKNKIKKREK